jgi:hypothetical protein
MNTEEKLSEIIKKMTSRYFRRDGSRYIGTWEEQVLQWGNDFEKRIPVGSTRLWWGGWCSTVWLGIDHSFGLGDRPLIFETMVFGWRMGSDFDMDRYATEEEAKAGHYKMVRRWNNPFRLIRHFIFKRS